MAFVNTKLIKSADNIITTLLSDTKEVEIFGYKLKIEKVNETDSGVYFSTIGGAKSINVAGIFHENLKNKFHKANKQLSFEEVNHIPVKKRVLLIVNKYQLLTFDWDLFEGLSYSYKELVNQYNNIDEIWFQVDDKGNNIPKLLYTKSLFAQVESLKFSDMSPQDCEVFAKWFTAIEKMDDEKKSNLIKMLKILLKEKIPHQIFPDSGTRIEMVRYGRWMAENNKRV